MFLHASAQDLTDAEWTVHDPVLHARTEIGETHVWAPHVIHHDGRYWMFFAGGTADHTAYRMTLATSDDLFTWTRHEPVLFEDGFDARDPMVIHDGRRWLMYYTRTSAPGGGHHQVAVRSSEDGGLVAALGRLSIDGLGHLRRADGIALRDPGRGGLDPVRVRVHAVRPDSGLLLQRPVALRGFGPDRRRPR